VGVGVVITLPARARVLLASRPVEFRKGVYSLAALASEVPGADPFSGVVLVFRAKRADWIKIVLWDGTEQLMVSKQLEGGALRWLPVVDGAVRLT
jgi:transposase